MDKLPPLVESLLKPQAYSHDTRNIQLVQTQMSFLFLTGDYVYKVKKPVNLGYLDYSTLEKRRYFCHQELELNRRLCPHAYLEVAPIVQQDTEFHVDGTGNIVEYTVKMKQLPQERMMDVLLTQGKVTSEMISQVAKKLAHFHHKAHTGPEIAAFGKLDVITQNTSENFSQTEKYIDVSLSSPRYNRIKRYTEDFTKNNNELFRKRVEQGRIKDCHGDLHTAHVCFTDDICIYDCIEFNERFRYSDVASEIAFLAMDLDHRQAHSLSRHLIDAYVKLSGDDDLLGLLQFYQCYRAYVRGKVESFKLDDPYFSATEKESILQTAKEYFGLAYSYTRNKPLLLITSGLVGTGKSTVAQAIAREFGLSVISSDVIRKTLANITPTEHHFEQYHQGIYSPDFSRKTYKHMFQQAWNILSQGESVILDASFGRRDDRQHARELAELQNANFIIIECQANEQEIQRRLEERLKQETVSDGRWEIFQREKQDFQSITEMDNKIYIVADTTQPADKIIKEIESKL
ncbi:MAG: AAA family ATPase [Dehalococcoidia bacterium]|nr:AAA family ATPase [Dehalococcoidia bacterium]